MWCGAVFQKSWEPAFLTSFSAKLATMVGYVKISLINLLLFQSSFVTSINLDFENTVEL